MAVAKTWTNFIASTTARAAEVLGNDAWSEGNLVPHSEGTLANDQFSLGTTTARWNWLYSKNIDMGSATVYVDGTNHRLAIGHKNPSQTIDIAARIDLAASDSAYMVFTNNDEAENVRKIKVDCTGAYTNFRVTSDDEVSTYNFLWIQRLDMTSVSISVRTATTEVLFMSQKIAVGHGNPSQTVDISGSLYVAGGAFQHRSGTAFQVSDCPIELSDQQTGSGLSGAYVRYSNKLTGFSVYGSDTAIDTIKTFTQAPATANTKITGWIWGSYGGNKLTHGFNGTAINTAVATGSISYQVIQTGSSLQLYCKDTSHTAATATTSYILYYMDIITGD